MPNPFATGALLYVRGYTVVARTLRAEQHAVETQAYAICRN